MKEFSAIPEDYQNTYKYLCALESLGVVVHRQLVIRILDIAVQDLRVILDNLDGLVEEFVIDKRSGVYGWRGRHPVISKIVMEYKFSDTTSIFNLCLIN